MNSFSPRPAPSPAPVVSLFFVSLAIMTRRRSCQVPPVLCKFFFANFFLQLQMQLQTWHRGGECPTRDFPNLIRVERGMEEVFAQWNSGGGGGGGGGVAGFRAPPPSTAISVVIPGIVCSSPLSNRGVYRILPDNNDDELVETARRESAPNPTLRIFPHGPIDRVFPLDRVVMHGVYEQRGRNGGNSLHGGHVELSQPMSEWMTPEVMAKQHVQFPDGRDTLGPPFVLYSGLTASATCPGLHRTPAVRDFSFASTFTNKKGIEQRRLTYTSGHRQWSTKPEFERGPELITIRLTLWDDSCRELPGDGLTRDLQKWSAIMDAHPDIRFHALVAVDTSYQLGGGMVNLKVLAVRWELGPYLEQHAICIPDHVVERLVPRVRQLDDNIVNMSTEQARPTGSEWRYYGLTANPTLVNTVAALEQKTDVPCVFFAMRRLVANPAPASPSSPPPLSSDEEEFDAEIPWLKKKARRDLD